MRFRPVVAPGTRVVSLLALACMLLVPWASRAAHADPVKCQREILKASLKFAQLKMKTLQKCEDGVVTGKSAGPCPDPKAAAKITKADGKLRDAVAKRCGGGDRICGTPDDDALAAIGWDIGTCPNLESGSCTNAILDCAGIAECLACVTETAVDQAISLYYDAFVSSTDQTIVKCQRAIGKETAKFFDQKTKALKKCEDDILKGKIAGPCPDAKAGAKIAKAEAKKVDKICKTCGGADRVCGGGDDLTPAAIGFAASCPDVDVPGGPACGGAISTLQHVVTCVDCVTEFKADCVDALAMTGTKPYPSECGGAPCTLPQTLPDVLAFTVEPPGVDLDSGWTGLSHDVRGPSNNGVLAARISNCDTDTESPTCGQCDLAGPVEFPGDSKNCACFDLSDRDASSLAACDPEASACGGAETCECFYGPPLPISSGAVPVCVTNRYTAPVTGTTNISDTGPDAGKGGVFVRLESIVHTGLAVDQPCPVCLGDPTPRDGVKGGTCSGGAQDGNACDVAGDDTFFGAMSFDCLPNRAGNIGTLDIKFNEATTGTSTLGTGPACTASGYGSFQCFCDTCPTPNAEPCNTDADCPGGLACGGKRCVGGSNNGTPCAVSSECPSGGCSRPGTPTAPNQCADAVCSPNPGDTDHPNEGICEAGPIDQVCDLEPFRGCTSNNDCNPPPAGNCGSCAPNQQCTSVLRQCFVNPIVRTGMPGTQMSTVAVTFCIPPTSAASVNQVAGLPGPGALTQPTRTFRIGALCGDGAVDAGEQCDGAADTACPGQCGFDCQCPAAAVCGDGVVNQGSEQCDGADDGACPGGCQADCTCGPFCGDDTVNQGSEQCDGSDDGACPGACQANCQCPICGDDVVNQGSEQCDGSDDGACPGACQGDCTCGPFCGDDTVNQGSEQCDGSDPGVCPGACEADCTCAPFCGNDTRETGELCDGTDDALCPGACQGDCTCPAIGELSFVVQPGADLDTGWSGTSHQFSVQAGTRIDGEIAACDNVTDFECTYFANVGSFCSGNPSLNCTENTQCPTGQTCVIQTYGPPLPLSSGGTPVCVINRHAADVTGSYDLSTGAAAITVPLNSVVHLATNVSRPCPICDCGELDPQNCQIGESGNCSEAPFNACTVEGTGPFGPTSNDCLPNPGTNVSGGGLNLGFAPATTGTSSFPSNTPCTGAGFQSQSCWGPGQPQPNACSNGCDGGANNDLPCDSDTDCPGGGVCKPLCRQITGEEVGEGQCVAGPVDQTCAGASEITCSDTTPCPLGLGPCETTIRRCFLDPIVRIGAPGTQMNVFASTFFIPATSSPAVNNTAGLPGPGAIRFGNDLGLAFCGDGSRNRLPEDCDGGDDTNCPGACGLDCKCPAASCGNNLTEFPEQCDGTDDGACPGLCVAAGNPDECTCPAVCGDGFVGPGEQCDPPNDQACPGECNLVTCQCPAAVCGNGVIESGETCELPAQGCGPFQVCVGCTQCAP